MTEKEITVNQSSIGITTTIDLVEREHSDFVNEGSTGGSTWMELTSMTFIVKIEETITERKAGNIESVENEESEGSDQIIENTAPHRRGAREEISGTRLVEEGENGNGKAKRITVATMKIGANLLFTNKPDEHQQTTLKWFVNKIVKHSKSQNSFGEINKLLYWFCVVGSALSHFPQLG